MVPPSHPSRDLPFRELPSPRGAAVALRRLVPAGLLVLAVGCGDPPEAPPLPPDPLPLEESARAMEVGGPAAGALAQGLVARLTAAMDEEGVEGAVTFCADAAIPLTLEIQAEQPEDVTLKRATLRWRNPDNAPDEWEERVLRYLEELEGFDPESVPEELTAQGPEGSLRYYRVLRTGPMCLNCHGDESAMDPGVRERIRTSYPGDQATGYGAGDFRGVIRVEIPRGE